MSDKRAFNRPVDLIQGPKPRMVNKMVWAPQHFLSNHHWYYTYHNKHNRSWIPDSFCNETEVLNMATAYGVDFEGKGKDYLKYLRFLGLIPCRVPMGLLYLYPEETVFCLVQIQRHKHRGVNPVFLSKLIAEL
jgi:hypothetical protein